MNANTSKMKWLWENMKGYRALYVVGIVGTLVYNLLQLVVPHITSQVIDLFISGENAAENLTTKESLFYQLIILMVVLTIFRTVVVYGTCMIFEHASQSVLFKVRNFLYDKVQRQDMKFYSAYRTGDLMTRMTGDLDAVRHMIAWVIRTIIESFALASATMIYFFYMYWLLALAVLAVSPCVLYATGFILIEQPVVIQLTKSNTMLEVLNNSYLYTALEPLLFVTNK